MNSRSSVWRIAPFAVLFLEQLAALGGAAHSQTPGVWSQETVDTIIGAEVTDGQIDARHKMGDIIRAIEASDDAASTVRKTSNLDIIDIAFLTDIAGPDTSFPKRLSDSLETYRAEIEKLRHELEGNAILYRAIESHRVLMRDVLAVRIENGHALIYVLARR
ncbi:hypothetical protein ACFPLB_01340 [Aquamicrobium segne]|uniref:Uncharacterized protein n=1 Tax=Aquamicrobium segne TaxID=469547 RepID=A0ABW0GTT5_9HYPH